MPADAGASLPGSSRVARHTNETVSESPSKETVSSLGVSTPTFSTSMLGGSEGTVMARTGTRAERPSSRMRSPPARLSTCCSNGASWKYGAGKTGERTRSAPSRRSSLPASCADRTGHAGGMGARHPGRRARTASTTIGVDDPTGFAGSAGPPAARSYTRGMRVKGRTVPRASRSPNTKRRLSKSATSPRNIAKRARTPTLGPCAKTEPRKVTSQRSLNGARSPVNASASSAGSKARGGTRTSEPEVVISYVALIAMVSCERGPWRQRSARARAEPSMVSWGMGMNQPLAPRSSSVCSAPSPSRAAVRQGTPRMV